ncbi:hypothetical protein GW626_04640 [Peribacillus muralis]|nr:hypothetical protein [Peribacillus muralis]MCK1993084.1 hypothetical protein [Peribacillus muralis]MCK2013639.1 hypothetical protein [Peribacillus muralis]
MMNMYVKAFESYLKICERYEIETLNFDDFIKNLTKDQLDEYSKLAV